MLLCVNIGQPAERLKHRAFTLITSVGKRDRAVEVLLLQSPRGVVQFVGDPTWAVTVHLDGCGERREKGSPLVFCLNNIMLHVCTFWRTRPVNCFVCQTAPNSFGGFQLLSMATFPWQPSHSFYLERGKSSHVNSVSLATASTIHTDYLT